MDTIFMNSKNSEASNPQRLLLYVTDKTDLRRNKYVALSNLSNYYTWKNIKKHIWTINLKFHLYHGIKNLNYLMDHTLYRIFKITLKIYIKITWRRDY